MAKRILGQNCKILISFDAPGIGFAQSLLSTAGVDLGIPLGDFDSFREVSRGGIHIARPIGTTLERGTPIYGGYDIEIAGGKTDGFRAYTFAILEELYKNGVPYEFKLLRKITYFNGIPEIFVYNNVVFYNLETIIGSSSEQITEPIKAFASEKTPMGIDVSGLANSIKNGSPTELLKSILNL